MKRFITCCVLSGISVLLLVSLTAGLACADDKETAVKLVKAAVAYLAANGEEKGLDALNNPNGEFVKGELYVFAYDMNGVLLANSFRLNLLGQNLLDVPDANGKKFRREIIELAKSKGSGWVDYAYQNPKTKQVEQKTTYLEKAGDMVLCCGIYKK
jgi:signal transduction histidine kinase